MHSICDHAWLCFYYIGTCAAFITGRIAEYCYYCSEFKCGKCCVENNKPTTPNLNLNPPESVNECKSDIKKYLLMQPCYVNLREFELFCQTVVSQIHTGALHLSSATSYRVSYRASLPLSFQLQTAPIHTYRYVFFCKNVGRDMYSQWVWIAKNTPKLGWCTNVANYLLLATLGRDPTLTPAKVPPARDASCSPHAESFTKRLCLTCPGRI